MGRGKPSGIKSGRALKSIKNKKIKGDKDRKQKR